MSNSNNINIEVTLDEQKVPEQIKWSANQSQEPQKTDAFFLSLFDPVQRDTLRIDLWTKDMSIPNMEIFMHNTLKSMGRSFAKAVGDAEVIAKFDQFADSLLPTE